MRNAEITFRVGAKRSAFGHRWAAAHRRKRFVHCPQSGLGADRALLRARERGGAQRGYVLGHSAAAFEDAGA